MKSFLRELIKRRVFRTTGAYIGIGYALLLVSQSLEFALNLPTWFDTSVISILALGLAPVIILAWAFQFTSEGLVRNKDIPTSDLAKQDDRRDLRRPFIQRATMATVYGQGYIAARNIR